MKVNLRLWTSLELTKGKNVVNKKICRGSHVHRVLEQFLARERTNVLHVGNFDTSRWMTDYYKIYIIYYLYYIKLHFLLVSGFLTCGRK